jgi:hypothetical protein
MLALPVGVLVLDPKIRQFQVPLDDRQMVLTGKCLRVLEQAAVAFRLGPVEELLIFAFELVVELHADDAATV